MEEFLKNPSESTAIKMFETLDLQSIISSCETSEQGCELLRLLFQLNKFNIIVQLGIEGLLHLLNYDFLQKLILDHLKCIEFPRIDYNGLISELLKIFVSEDISSATLCKDILVQKLGELISQELYMPRLLELLNSSDSIIKIRGLELVVQLANTYNFQVFDTNGLIDTGIEMVTGNDILLRMVAIEVIAELGSSEPGCKKLLSHKIKSIIKTAIEEELDLHTKNKLILLACKIFHFTGNESFIDGKFWESLISMLTSDDLASVKNGLNGICYLASRSSGLAQIFSNQRLLTEWSKLQRSSNSNTKSYFYHSFYEFLKLSSEENVMDYYRVSNFIPHMTNELLTPFQDSHSDILNSITMLVKHKSQALAFLNENKFKEYLFKRPPHQTHEVSYLKYNIMTELNKHELPLPLQDKVQRYLQAGVFSIELDMELDSLT
jgi:Proteasome non-ATPase 26S subunit